MKKLAVILIVLTLSVSTCACATAIDKYNDKISELRDELIVGESEGVEVEIICGRRESSFNIDGNSTPKCDFTVITVTSEIFALSTVVNYAFNFNGQIYDGALNKHPLKNSYSTELPFRVSGEIDLKITQGKIEKIVKTKTVKTERTISANRALEVAQIRLADKFSECSSNGKLNAEIYIRYIKNPISTAHGYYWYVALCPNATTVYAVLIDEVSANIVAVRE